MMIGTRGDEISVHGPVVVFAKGEAISGMVVTALGERYEMGGVDEGDVLSGWEFDTEAAGGALVIVDFEDLAAESGRAAVFEFLFGDFGGWERHHRSGCRPKQNGGMVRKVTGDESFAHFPAVFGDGDDEFEAVGETGRDLADVADEWLGLQRFYSRGAMFCRQPEAILAQVEERILRTVLIIVFPDDFEPCRESVPQFPAPRDAVGCGNPVVDEVENREEEEWFVRSLMTLSSDPDNSDVEGVKAFDSGIQKHGGSQSGILRT